MRKEGIVDYLKEYEDFKYLHNSELLKGDIGKCYFQQA